MSRGTPDPAACFALSPTGLSPSLAGFPKTVPLALSLSSSQSFTPTRSRAGLGSSGFARRYSRNRCFFLFLRLLRCFSSPGSLPHPMDSRAGDRGPPCRVSPFGHPRIDGYLPLPGVFRSLSRPSSALSAKASALRPSSLNLSFGHVASCPLVRLLFLAFASRRFFRWDASPPWMSLSSLSLVFSGISLYAVFKVHLD